MCPKWKFFKNYVDLPFEAKFFARPLMFDQWALRLHDVSFHAQCLILAFASIRHRFF